MKIFLELTLIFLFFLPATASAERQKQPNLSYEEILKKSIDPQALEEYGKYVDPKTHLVEKGSPLEKRLLLLFKCHEMFPFGSSLKNPGMFRRCKDSGWKYSPNI